MPRLKAELENIDEEEYSLSNWNEVILYITGSQSIDSMGINEASKAKRLYDSMARCKKD